MSQIWTHGLATVVTALAVWLAFAFVADWALSVPAPVRWLHLGVLVALPTFVALRALIRPLRRAPDKDGMAILIERAHPELSELVVSAVQLARRPTGSPELVDRTIELAEERAASLTTEGVFDLRGPRRRMGYAFASVAVLALGAWSNPHFASIFVQRLFGGDVPWPQRTHLAISVPLSDRAQVEESADTIRVRVARGTDVPVLVRADGEIPSEVLLSFDEGRELVLTPTGGGVSPGRLTRRRPTRSTSASTAMTSISGASWVALTRSSRSSSSAPFSSRAARLARRSSSTARSSWPRNAPLR